MTSPCGRQRRGLPREPCRGALAVPDDQECDEHILHRQAGILAVRAERQASSARVGEGDVVGDHLERVHGQRDAVRRRMPHNGGHLWQLENAAKDDDAHAQCFAHSEAQACRLRQVRTPDEQRIALIAQERRGNGRQRWGQMLRDALREGLKRHGGCIGPPSLGSRWWRWQSER